MFINVNKNRTYLNMILNLRSLKRNEKEKKT